ncbi:MAG: cryptochrome/photolyase family protein [Myxococcaceae bacterium]|nr:cryptochrome/photolyase family protein [Myxococcaceae bacterium]MCA3016499.1 cryptochrome/photolyase family protein [Myxococcaceae bacterium]
MSAPLPVDQVTRRPTAGAQRVTVVLPWDQDPSLSAFPKTPADGQLLVLETRAKVHAMPWHRQKLTLIVSSLRHFVEERRAAGFHVEHRLADDYASGVEAFAAWARPGALHAMAPKEWAIDGRFRALTRRLPLTLHDDGGPGGHFLTTRDEFAAWVKGRKQVRMDQFYPLMRQKLNLLVDGKGKPIGGKWSFDAENREHARGVKAPPIPWFTPDALTQTVMRWVARDGVGSWGRLDGFGWPVTRAQALSWLEHFVETRLEGFGPYEDAIRSDERFLFHSLLSVPLNLGLLRPDEVARAAASKYERGHVSLASAEGFIRQVIGWREFIRGVYWWLMPGLREANGLAAHGPLPDFFWAPERTDLQCVKEAVQSVHDTGYAHHIQRLMVLCNYATLAGLDPRAVSFWFWAAFVDAYEWVELPNVVGMGLHATDAFTTKPYVASAAYLKRQSGLSAKGRGPQAARDEAPCARCRYDPDVRVGPTACPFNAMYWDFLDRHRARLSKNLRMRQLLTTLDRFGEAQVDAIRRTAQAHRDTLRPFAPPWAFHEDRG